MTPESGNNYFSSVVARYQGSPVPGFLAWWRGELATLVPGSLRARMVPPRPQLWLVAESDGSAFSIWNGADQVEQVDRFSMEEDAHLQRDRWVELVNGFKDGKPEVSLCLPADMVLDCPVELPIAVESNLAAAIGFQLDQLTPFKASQVYHDYRIESRDTQHGRLKLDLRLVAISRVEPLLKRLATIGIRPHAIDTLNQHEGVPAREGFNLLPESERARYVYARARLNWALAGLAVLLLGLVMAQSLYQREQKIDRLQASAAELRVEAEQVMGLQRQLEDSLQAANFLAERRRSQPVIIQVIDEVSRILPTDMWINQMQVRGDELLMMGLADGSQRLIEIINDSPLLLEAEFRGAINVDPATGQERFNLRATINRRGVQHAVAAGPGE
jgi:general secretion pathway protein L